MKTHTLAVLVLISFLTLVSCENEDINLPDSHTINAVVENGSRYNAFVSHVKAVIDYGDVEFDVAMTEYKSGGFKLTLPAVIPDNMLVSADELSENSKLFFRLISDKEAKFTEVRFYAYNKQNNRSFYEFRSMSDSSSFKNCSYVYADRDFSIRGKLKGYNYIGTNDYLEYDVDLKKGWNVMYQLSNLITTKMPEEFTYKWQYTGAMALNIVEYEHYKYTDSNQNTIYLRFQGDKYIISFDGELKQIDFDAFYNEYTGRSYWSSSDLQSAGTWTVVGNGNEMYFSGIMSSYTAFITDGGEKINFSHIYHHRLSVNSAVLSKY